jgi:hypothetical protein
MRLPLVAAAATIAGLTFTGTASADNISVPVAKSKCRAYVQDVMNRTDYVEASFKATPAFPGHNHYVRCAVSYDTAATATKKYYACKETLDIYMLAHSGDRTRTIFMRHITDSCSSKVLRGPTPG